MDQIESAISDIRAVIGARNDAELAKRLHIDLLATAALRLQGDLRNPRETAKRVAEMPAKHLADNPGLFTPNPQARSTGPDPDP